MLHYFVVVLGLVFISCTYAKSTPTENSSNHKLRALLTSDVPECKTLIFEATKTADGVSCSIKNESFHFDESKKLGQGTHGIVFDVGDEKRAVKFVKNEQKTYDWAMIKEENKLLKIFKENNITNVAEIQEPTDVDETANMFVITMKKYYKDVNKFIAEDVSKLQWNSLSMLRFVSKLGVKK